MSARMALSAGKGNARSPSVPPRALTLKARAPRYSDTRCIRTVSPPCIGIGGRRGPGSATRGRRHELVGVLLPPHDELAILHERGLNQRIEHIVHGVADETRVEHECV